MRSSKQRQRNKQNRTARPSGGNVVNRVFDSSGPEGKVRGTPAQIIEKYAQLHRDAQLAGDRVNAENFAQHAEHYTRMLAEAQRDIDRVREEQEQAQRDRGGFDRPRDGVREGGDRGERPNGERPFERERSFDRGPERQGDRFGERQPDRQADRQPDRQPERAPDRGPDRPGDRPADRFADRDGFDRRERDRAARLRAQEEAAAAPTPAPAPVMAPEVAAEPAPEREPDLADAGFLRTPLFPVHAAEAAEAPAPVEAAADAAPEPAEAPSDLAAEAPKAPRRRARRPRPPEAAPVDAAE